MLKNNIDLDAKTVIRDGVIIIKNGNPQNGYKIDPTPVSFAQLETLYNAYKHSIPDGYDRGKSYFKALTYDQLSLDDLLHGSNRQNAKQNLEMAIITGVLNGSLTWNDDTHWFWQSQIDKDFVILKKWIQLENTNP